MLKKSKIVALLVVCVMMFAVVEPALAWWGEDTAYGTAVGGATGGLWGAVIGAVAIGAGVVRLADGRDSLLQAAIEGRLTGSNTDNWRWVRLKEVGITSTGTTPSTEHREYYNGDIPL